MTTTTTIYRVEFRSQNTEPWQTFLERDSKDPKGRKEIIDGINRLKGEQLKVRVAIGLKGRPMGELCRIA